MIPYEHMTYKLMVLPHSTSVDTGDDDDNDEKIIIMMMILMTTP